MQSKIDIKNDEESDFFFGLKNEVCSQKRLRSNSKANLSKRIKKREQSKQNNQLTSLKEIKIFQEKQNIEELEESYQLGIDENPNINRPVFKVQYVSDIEIDNLQVQQQEQIQIHKSLEDILNVETKTNIIDKVQLCQEEKVEDIGNDALGYQKQQGELEFEDDYKKLYERDYEEDNYNLQLVYDNGFETIMKNFSFYNDHSSCLQLRKVFVLICELISLGCEKIIVSTLYKYIMLMLISTNIVLVVAKYYGNFYQQYPYFFDRQTEVFFQIYVIEIIIRILGQNIIQFFKRFWNIFDLLNVLILGMVIFKIITFDFSPLRAIRVLIFLSQLSPQLQLTFMALIKSFQYMVESLLIVLIFCVFFANVGRQQFDNVFYNRCVNLELGIAENEQLCGWLECNHGANCVNIPFYLSSDTITNFNSFSNSFISIIRIITMDDWTNLMYPTLYTLSPFTWIYFVFVIFIVGFFAFNLIIAILKTQYSNIVNNYSNENENDINGIDNEKQTVNLRLIKNLGIYKKIIQHSQTNHDQKSHHNQFSSSQSSLIMQQPFLLQNGSASILTPQVSAKILAKETVKKFENFLKHSEQQKKIPQITQMLSARQRKEQEQNCSQRTNEIVQIDCQIRQCLLPKRILFLENLKGKVELEKELDQIQILRSSDVLNWKVEVIYSEYTSQSQTDVFGQKQEQLKRELKLQAELEKIKKKNSIQQYYYLKNEEIQIFEQQNKNTLSKHKMPIKQSKRKIKYESLTFEDLKQDQIFLKSPKQHSFCNDKKFRLLKKKSTSTIRKQTSDCFFQFPEYQEGQNFLILNGVKWNYESVRILIDRGKDEEPEPSNNYNDHLNDQFFSYLKFRRKEIKKGYISAYNQSILDLNVKKRINFISIFKALNQKNYNIWIKGIKGGLTNIVKIFLNIALIRFFFDSVVLINFINLCSIGLLEDEIIDELSFYITTILVGEFLLKLFRDGLIDFAKIPSNVTDALVFSITITYYSLTSIDQDLKLKSEIKVLRAANSILLYRFIEYNNFILRIMSIAKITFKKYLSLTFFLFSIILIFSILGMQFFIEHFQEDESSSQLHSFKSFAKSWMTIFNIITNDDAIGMLKVVLKVQQPWIGITFYIATVFSINYLTNGLVMAVLLDAFSSELEKENNYQFEIQQDDLRKQGITKNIQIQDYEDNFEALQLHSPSKKVKQIINSQTKINIRDLPQTSQKLFISQHKQNKFIYYKDTKCSCSLYLFSYHNAFRKFCYRICKHWIFRLIQNGLVLISIVDLVFSLEKNDIFKMLEKNSLNTYHEMNFFILNSLITFSYLIQIIAMGFIVDQGALLKDLWKLNDLIYLFFFYLNFVTDAKIVRVFRVLSKFQNKLVFCRPLLLINMFESVQGVKQSMVKSLFKIIHIVAVILLVFMVFNVFGLHLYQNKMGYCDNLLNFHVNVYECKATQSKWINHPFNFDNFQNGLFTLTMISSLDAWGEIMQVCYNGNTPDKGPNPFQNQWPTYIFFIIFVFIGGMFFMGFLTGVLFIEFQKFTKKIENKNLTQEQSSFIQICSIILKQKPNYSHAPNSFLRKIAYKIVFSKKYKSLYNYVLVAYGILLCCLFEIKNEKQQITANWVCQFFTFLFIFDCILKLLAYGLIRYLATNWRILEFFLTLFSIIDLSYDVKYKWFYHYTNSLADYQISFFSRIFLIMRNVKILLLFQEFIGLQRLLRVLFFSSPLLFKILYIQLSIQATYALIGYSLFSNIKKGHAIDDNYLNFSSFLNSVLVLFKCTTGDDWRALIIDCSRQNQFCYEDEQSCGSNWSYVYFLSYYLLSNIIVMNLFVLALVDQFENFFNQKTNVIQTFVENIDHFCNCWCRYSYETKGKKMHTRYIGRFLLDLNQPLGAQKGDNIWDAAKDAFNFRIKADKRGLVNFNDLLYEVIRFAFYEKIFKEGTRQGRAEMKLFDLAIKKRLSGDFSQLTASPDTNEIKAQESVDGSYDFKYGYQNFNILQEYLHLLIVFKTWKAYTAHLFEKSKQKGIEEFTEQSSDRKSSFCPENKIENSHLELQKDEKLYASQAIDDQNKEEIIKTFQESNKYHLTNHNSQNSTSFLGIIYEPSIGNYGTLSRMYSASIDQVQQKSILKKKAQTYTVNDLFAYYQTKRQGSQG